MENEQTEEQPEPESESPASTTQPSEDADLLEKQGELTQEEAEALRAQLIASLPFSQRLQLWLGEQPEYVAALGGDRATRRELGRVLGATLTGFPEAPPRPASVNRAARRSKKRTMQFNSAQRYSRRRALSLAQRANLEHDAKVAQALLDEEE